MKQTDSVLRKCLVIADEASDFTSVLESCGTKVDRIPFEKAYAADLADYDVYCVLAGGKVLDPRLRVRLEEENAKGKRIFTEALNSWGGIYSADPADTARRRLVVVQPEGEEGIPGLSTGDLLEDQSNSMMQPWYTVPGL